MSAGKPKQIFAGDLKVGMAFAGKSRQMTDDHFRAFAEITGDNHPIHYDDAYAAKTRFGRRLAHGLLVMSMTALGATPMGPQLEDSMVAFIEQGGRFRKPVFVGDELTTFFVVAAIEARPDDGTSVVRFDITLENQRGETVLKGHHSYLLLTAPGSQQEASPNAN